MKNKLLDSIINEYVVLPLEKEDLKSMIKYQIMKMFQRGQISAVEAASATADIDQTVDELYGQSERNTINDLPNDIIRNIKSKSIERRDMVDHIVEITNADILDLMIKSAAYDEIVKSNMIDVYTAEVIETFRKEFISVKKIVTYKKTI